MTFRAVADTPIAGTVYAEGWQSWSPMRLYRAGEAGDRAAGDREQVVAFRPGRPVPEGVIQGEGILAVAPPDGPARAWYSPQPAFEVATLRLARNRDRLELTADGQVEEVEAAGLDAALAAVGDRLGTGRVRSIPAGWCSWSYYFQGVTERDVVENVESALRLGLPIDIAQLDDGYETSIGDWLDVRERFGSLQRLAGRIGAAGMQPGIWLAPFLVAPSSTLAKLHPDWLLAENTAGLHWGEEMRILDVTRAPAAEHLSGVFRTLAGWGFGYFKLDFLYAAAIPGLEAYRRGMELIREAVGPDAILLACGAPLLPSIGLCDAMRIGPDILQETADPQLDLDSVVRITQLRRWMTGRLWVNDPDCLVARPQIEDREAWAAHLERYGGLRFSSDRLSALDERGLELTRRVLASG